jgi:His-Xaa-Ser system protein HxsD
MSELLPRIEFDTGRATAILSIDKKVHSKSAILKVCYWLSEDLYFQVTEEESQFSVTVGLREVTPTLNRPSVKKIDEWLPDILNALVDAQLREEIQAETAEIRELIIAKAFAESGILEGLPPGTFIDPVETTQPESTRLVKIENTRIPK